MQSDCDAELTVYSLPWVWGQHGQLGLPDDFFRPIPLILLFYKNELLIKLSGENSLLQDQSTTSL